jgi:hypothetical protein
VVTWKLQPLPAGPRRFQASYRSANLPLRPRGFETTSIRLPCIVLGLIVPKIVSLFEYKARRGWAIPRAHNQPVASFATLLGLWRARQPVPLRL